MCSCGKFGKKKFCKKLPHLQNQILQKVYCPAKRCNAHTDKTKLAIWNGKILKKANDGTEMQHVIVETIQCTMQLQRTFRPV